MAKSKIIDGFSYEYNDKGDVIAMTDHSTFDAPVPVSPESDLFANQLRTSGAITAYNFNKHGGNKELYGNTITLVSDEELNKKYEKAIKDNVSKLLDTTDENVILAAFPNLKSLYAVPKDTELYSYPADIDPNQDHLKISKYIYKRNESDADPVAQGSRPKRVETVNIPTSMGEKFRNLFNRIDFKDINNDGNIITQPVELERVVEGDSMLGNQLQGSVILPMPKVVDTNGCEWGESELNIFGLAAVAGAEQGQKIIGNKFLGRFGRGKNIENVTGTGASKEDLLAVEAITERAKRGGSFIKDFKRFGSAVANAAAAEATARVTGQSVSQDQFLARTSGRVLNPNAELLFQGPVLRDFNFDFLMIARSRDEGKEIRKIIRWFKSGMAPKFNSSTFLKTPDIFTLEYRRGDGNGGFETLKTVNRFSPGGLALRTIAVDYAVNGYWSAYEDSQPVAIKMSLNFAELRPIYAGDQNDPDLEDTVGF